MISVDPILSYNYNIIFYFYTFMTMNEAVLTTCNELNTFIRRASAFTYIFSYFWTCTEYQIHRFNISLGSMEPYSECTCLMILTYCRHIG